MAFAGTTRRAPSSGRLTLRESFQDLTRIMVGTRFGRFMLGDAISFTGIWMQRISVGWLTWQLTESGTWLGLVAFADFAPSVIVGPLTGAVADRWDRYRLLRASQLGSAGIAALLTVFYALGSLNIWGLLALTAIMGVCSGAAQPLRMSLINSLVARTDLHSAVTMNSIVLNASRFIGPAAASLLIVLAGIGIAFACGAATFAVFYLLLRPLSDAEAKVSQRQTIFLDIGEGIAYIATQPGLAAVILITFVSGICLRPVAEMLPGFADQVFHAGAVGLAVLSSAFGIGSMVGGALSMWPLRSLSLLTIMLGSVAVSALSLVVFAMTTSLWVGAALLVPTGAAKSALAISSLTAIHRTVPDRIRGRTISSYGMVIGLAPALGALLIGMLSDVIGLQMALIVALPPCLVICFAIFLRRGVIERNLRQD